MTHHTTDTLTVPTPNEDVLADIDTDGNAKVALAFSGGLDTTIGVKLLQDVYGFDDVIGVTVDVGQPAHELEEAANTAAVHGVENFVIDAKTEFAELCFEAVKANATYQGYPLGTALARPVIAQAILEVAEEEDCVALAHGCTGKGNDQLRFEYIWRQSDLAVIAPVRDLGLTRDWEKAYADAHDLPVQSGNDGAWSIDTNLWSRSVEGDNLEDPGYVPPNDIYEWTTDPTGDVEFVEIGFENGVPVSVDGENVDPVTIIEHLNERAGAHGVGRTDIMEDRMLGLKVRENYEHPAATTLLTAHEALEGLVLTKDEREFKHLVDQQWADKAYEGLIDSPFSAALDGFIDVTQQKVTGTVTIKFEGGQARAVARESAYSVFSNEASSFDTASVGDITQMDAIGVAKYHGFQSRLAHTAMADDEDAVEVVTDGGDGALDDTDGGGGE